MRSGPRWFLITLQSGNREYVRNVLAVKRYRFEDHHDGFLVFSRSVTGFAQWLTKQGVRTRTVAAPAEAAA